MYISPPPPTSLFLIAELQKRIGRKHGNSKKHLTYNFFSFQLSTSSARKNIPSCNTPLKGPKVAKLVPAVVVVGVSNLKFLVSAHLTVSLITIMERHSQRHPLNHNFRNCSHFTPAVRLILYSPPPPTGA